LTPGNRERGIVWKQRSGDKKKKRIFLYSVEVEMREKEKEKEKPEQIYGSI